MPSSKTDTAIRFPEDADQKRRLRNVTQDRRFAERQQREAGSAKAKAADTTWAPEQYMTTSMDEDGNPQPDPTAFTGLQAQKKGAKGEQEGIDMYDAANQDFD